MLQCTYCKNHGRKATGQVGGHATYWRLYSCIFYHKYWWSRGFNASEIGKWKKEFSCLLKRLFSGEMSLLQVKLPTLTYSINNFTKHWIAMAHGKSVNKFIWSPVYSRVFLFQEIPTEVRKLTELCAFAVTWTAFWKSVLFDVYSKCMASIKCI